MISQKEYAKVCREALALLDKAGVVLQEEERGQMSAHDFGLSHVRMEGAQILTLFETERIAAKVLVLLPHQTLPEHWHPRVGTDAGKEEVVRALWGELRAYVEGRAGMKMGRIPEGKEAWYTMRKEVILTPGEQLLLPPGSKHWFQGGASGAVLYSFSSKVRDLQDEFSDPAVQRETVIGE